MLRNIELKLSKKKAILIGLLYLITIIIFSTISYQKLSNDFKSEQANKAMILAIDISNRILTLYLKIKQTLNLKKLHGK